MQGPRFEVRGLLVRYPRCLLSSRAPVAPQRHGVRTGTRKEGHCSWSKEFRNAEILQLQAVNMRGRGSQQKKHPPPPSRTRLACAGTPNRLIREADQMKDYNMMMTFKMQEIIHE